MKPEFDLIMEEADRFLTELNFIMAEKNDGGMWKTFRWTNKKYFFSLTYDRGYYDCSIETGKNPVFSYDLIWLLRYIKKDKNFYVKELEDAGLLKTLTIKGYVELFLFERKIIEAFLLNHSCETRQSFEKFVNKSVLEKP